MAGDDCGPIGAVVGFVGVVIDVVESDVADVCAEGSADGEGACCAVGVQVVQGVFISEESVAEVGCVCGEDEQSFVGDLDVGFDDGGLVVSPCADGGLFGLGGACEVDSVVAVFGGAVDVDGDVGGVVVSVSCGCVVCCDVVCFGEELSGGEVFCIEVSGSDLESFEDGATEGEVIEDVGEGKLSCVGVDFGAWSEEVLIGVELNVVDIPASDAEEVGGACVLAVETAAVLVDGGETVFDPCESDLFESVVVEAIYVCGDDGVLVFVAVLGIDVAPVEWDVA